MPAPLYLLTGMNRNPRIFARLLPLLSGAVIVEWIEPLADEPIRARAQRLAHSLNAARDAIVCGVSFGGIIAGELAEHINARACVLISSVASPG